MMSSEDVPEFLYHFDTLEEPRIDRKKWYPLTELLFQVNVCDTACDCENLLAPEEIIEIGSRAATTNYK
ncbi:hypothetical protein ELY21_14620 [Legionella sp. km535]|uniref:hypothetical protein n=1 Tax=Legionella sp. km535 TaxID=2498107 RepID=UPI000F8F3835|nr:hypothetical protein [Legionella sp. km535]RUR15452.1 hypothetical protein ELY21_14620 [Legionella sp. km535]